MEITIFAKRRKSNDGRAFVTYLSTLTKKGGEKLTCSVKFKDTEPKPDDCPLNIVVDKGAANLSSRTYTDAKTGEIATAWTLWVGAWTQGGEYVDHSLDEFE